MSFIGLRSQLQTRLKIFSGYKRKVAKDPTAAEGQLQSLHIEFWAKLTPQVTSLPVCLSGIIFAAALNVHSGGGENACANEPYNSQNLGVAKTKARIEKSISLLDSGDARAAEREAYRAYQDDKNSLAAMLNLADCYMEHGRKAAALPLIQAALAKDSKNALAHCTLAKYCFLNQRPKQAIERAKYALQLDPCLAKAHFVLAKGLFATGQPGVEANLRKAIELDPKFAKAWAQLGWLSLRAKKYDDAVKAYEQACLANPKNADYFYWIGRVFYRSGQRSKAQKAYRQATEKFPKDDASWIGLGVLACEDGKLDEAERCFRKATEAAPAKALGWAELADVLVAQFKNEEAILAARRAVLLDPLNAGGYFALAAAQVGINDLPQAEASVRKAVQLQQAIEAKLLYQNFLVTILFLNAKNDQAVNLAATIYKLYPDHAVAQRTMALALMRTKQYDQGFAIARKLIAKYPNDLQAQNEYLTGLLDSGRPDCRQECRELARKMLTKHPEAPIPWLVLLTFARREKNKAAEQEAMLHLKNAKLDSHSLMEIGFAGTSGANQSSMALFSKALKQNPENADLLLNTRDPRALPVGK